MTLNLCPRGIAVLLCFLVTFFIDWMDSHVFFGYKMLVPNTIF